MMLKTRRRVAFRPALETLAFRATPSGAMHLDCPLEMPVEPLSSDIQPSYVTSTYHGDTVPPLYPPDGTPGTTIQDYM